MRWFRKLFLSVSNPLVSQRVGSASHVGAFARDYRFPIHWFPSEWEVVTTRVDIDAVAVFPIHWFPSEWEDLHYGEGLRANPLFPIHWFPSEWEDVPVLH